MVQRFVLKFFYVSRTKNEEVLISYRDFLKYDPGIKKILK